MRESASWHVDQRPLNAHTDSVSLIDLQLPSIDLILESDATLFSVN